MSRLTIANRTVAKAAELVSRMRDDFAGLVIAVGTDDPSQHDIVVNGTSLGLREGDALPLDVDRLAPEQIVAEIIMQPVETALLRAAAAKGCRVHFGAPMLATQVALMAEFMGGPAAEASRT